VPKTL